MARSYKVKADILLNKKRFYSFHVTLKRKNNHSNEFSVFKLVENEILHKILGLFCQKLNIEDGHYRNHVGVDL